MSILGRSIHDHRECGETAKLVIVLFNEGVTFAREPFEFLAVQNPKSLQGQESVERLRP
jgi:hypothetical protein